MRLFFAVELNGTARQELASLQAQLRQTRADVKWVEPENLHLTLKFLGEVEEGRLPELQQAAREVTAGFQPFTLSLEGVGAFPRIEHPRVIWVGIKEGGEALTALAAYIEEACGRLGFPAEERPFSPHLTIGRVHSGEQLSELVKKLEDASFKTSEPIRVDRLVLFESTLSPQGPTYTPAAVFPF